MNNLLVVQLLTQASTGMGLAAGLSWLLEKWPKWTALDQDKKRAAYLGMILIIALAAKFALNNVSESVWQALEPYVQVVFAVLAAWTTGTTLHTATRAATQITDLRQINSNLITSNDALIKGIRGMAEMISQDTQSRGLMTVEQALKLSGFSSEDIQKYELARGS